MTPIIGSEATRIQSAGGPNASLSLAFATPAPNVRSRINAIRNTAPSEAFGRLASSRADRNLANDNPAARQVGPGPLKRSPK
jgi:hypothetical protein